MQPTKQEKKDKSIFALERERNKLYRIQRDAPLIKLEKPMQNGWVKYWMLRDDYTRREDAHVFRTILKVIGTETFCRKKNFLDRHGKEYGPGLRIIGRNEMEMLQWTQALKKHFHFGLHYEKNLWGYSSPRPIEGWKIIRPFFFEEAIKPHFVTHVRTHYPDVESRLAQIQNKFSKDQLYNRLDNLRGNRKMSEEWRMAKSRYLETVGTKEVEEYDKSQ